MRELMGLAPIDGLAADCSPKRRRNHLLVVGIGIDVDACEAVDRIAAQEVVPRAELRDLLARPLDAVGREMNHVRITVKDQPLVLVRNDQPDRAAGCAVDAAARGEDFRRLKR